VTEAGPIQKGDFKPQNTVRFGLNGSAVRLEGIGISAVVTEVQMLITRWHLERELWKGIEMPIIRTRGEGLALA
jgi:hypothetical protein